MDVQRIQGLVPSHNIPELAPGDTVQVSVKVVEGERERFQQFQGTVIRVRQGGVGSSFTVRRIAQGVGVERTFPFHSPMLAKVEVLRRAKVRRAALYYLRGLSRKASRLKERGWVSPAAAEPVVDVEAPQALPEGAEETPGAE
ncbi:MAG: 50S ribosomal protein L19 [Chloroflexi bacterium]|nr:50S ribosomal protein L19 [Chloroflexota bacterium]